MEKINLFNFRLNIFYFLALTCIFFSFSPFLSSPLNASECQCNFCLNENFEEKVDYSQFGDFEQMFVEFDKLSEENECEPKTFFVKKWCRKAKRYFKKRLIKVVKKVMNIKDFRNVDDCAYIVAKFKRKIDKMVHKTDEIENILVEFDKIANEKNYPGMKSFSNKIQHYSNNKDARPPKHPDHNRYDFNVDHIPNSGELDDVPPRALFGGVEMTCGALICPLPFPGCAALGSFLVGHGFSQIVEAYLKEWEKQNQEHEVHLF